MSRAPAQNWALSLVWLAVFAGHALAAFVAYSLLPHGFPPLHPRFFVSDAVPALLAAASLAGAALFFVRPARAGLMLAAFPAWWWGAAAALALVFPITGKALLWPVLLFAVFVSLAYAPLLARAPGKSWLPLPLFVGLLGGGLTVRCLRAPDPTTRPLAARGPASPANADEALPEGVNVDLNEVRITRKGSPVRLWLEPELEFVSRSPDRFWSIFASGKSLPQRPVSTFSARAGALRAVVVESWTELHEPVFSHLNSFLELGVTGHTRLSLRFSPCEDVTLDVLHADYPSGAPARFAYVDASGEFRVVEASDAEKGPYHTLARGRLLRGAPLGVTFLDTTRGAVRELFRITLHDWSSQLSTALSPTAGYGVPENAVEFRLSAPEPTASAHLFVTLAGTGVGRGWDSVGHAAGAYRNRLTVAFPADVTPP